MVHGLVLELEGGGRAGACLENSQDRMALGDDAGLLRREGRWEGLRPGERITRVSGAASTIGYLAAKVSLSLSSGRSITFSGVDADSTSAAPFDFEAQSLPSACPWICPGICPWICPWICR